MTERTFKSIMNRIPAGEYPANAWDIYAMACPKSYQDMNKWKNYSRRMAFVAMFIERKRGFEYMFSGKIRYIGTNDLDTLIVK